MPTSREKEKLKNIISQLKNEIQKEVDKRKLPATAALMGSTAKDTYLTTDLDIDLFVIFPPKTSRETLQENVLAIGKKILQKTEECYAEHPYIRGFYKEYKTEIVPCYDVKSAENIISSVDRTPHHTRYIKKHLTGDQKNEVRLLKQFLRGIGCYGAEAEVEGFSGYLCELLILKFMSFHNLLRAAKKWRFGETLSLTEGEFTSFDDPLIFIDPVDSTRNVASALSQQKFSLFIAACKEYLDNPRITFFFPKKVQPWSLKKIRSTLAEKESSFVGVIFSKPDILSETLYPQIRKAVRSIKQRSEQQGFSIEEITFYVDEEHETIYIIIQTPSETLSSVKIHRGPPVKLQRNALEFRKKWKEDSRAVSSPYVENGRLYVRIKREYVDIKQFLDDNLPELSLGKDIDKQVKENYEVVGEKKLLKEDLRVFWTTLLDDKMPWER